MQQTVASFTGRCGVSPQKGLEETACGLAGGEGFPLEFSDSDQNLYL